MKPLNKKTILITGASRGLGKELARHFWSKGANLILVSRSFNISKNILNDLSFDDHQKVDYISCDLSNENTLPELICKLKRYELDAIINNAAKQTPIGNHIENDWSEWKKTIQVNFLSPIYICHELVPNMLKLKDSVGSIINLSGGGVTAPRPNFSAYAAAKSGLVGFTATLAEELRGKNIRVNSVAPGPMPTEMLHDVLKAGLKRVGEKEILSANKVFNQSSSSFERVVRLCEFLIGERSLNVTGKLISAIWDTWEDFDRLPDEILKSDIFTMRRIAESDRKDFLSGFHFST